MSATGTMSGGTDSRSSLSTSSSDSGSLPPPTPDRGARYSKSVPRNHPARSSLDGDTQGTLIRTSRRAPVSMLPIVLPQTVTRRPGKLSKVTTLGRSCIAAGDYMGIMGELAAIAEVPQAGPSKRPEGGAGSGAQGLTGVSKSTSSGSLSSSGGGDQSKWSWKRMGWKKIAGGVPLPSPSSQDEMVTEIEDRLVKAKSLATTLPALSDHVSPPPTPTRSKGGLSTPSADSRGSSSDEKSDVGSLRNRRKRVESLETGGEVEAVGGSTSPNGEVGMEVPRMGQHKSLFKELEEMRSQAERAEKARLRAEHKVLKALADADRSLKEVEEQNRVRETESAQKIAFATQEASRALAEAEKARRVARKEAKKTEMALTSAAKTWAALEEEARRRQEAEQAAFWDNKTKAIIGNYTQYAYEDLQAATNNFNPSKKIGEGGFGTVYGGTLHHTKVAIKVLKNQDGIRAHSEFKQELEVLGEIHHPHMVMLLGCCPSHFCLIYEFMGCGSLEERLACSDPKKTLPWYTRVRICAEVASALLVLHSRPVPIVHRDLKPANILLDKNLVAKLGDVGLAKFMMTADANATCMKDSRPVGTFAYVDPEFQRTGEFGPKSDVYAFGIVLLDMLTGRKPQMYEGIEEALDSGNEKKLSLYLDPAAGDWPIDIALEMAMLAVQCSEMRRKKRPDLGNVVMPQLEKLRAYALAVEEQEERKMREVPKVLASLCCPITQAEMQNPVLAADGYTYEHEAIVQWFRSSNLSPVTDELLPHTHLMPNHAVTAMIREHHHRQR